MCVRTLTGNEVESVQTDSPVVQNELEGKQSKNPDKLTKAKEKYIKLHNDMVTKERKLEVDRQQKINHDLFMPEINQDILAKGTAIFGNFCSKVSTRYSDFQQTKFYRQVL